MVSACGNGSTDARPASHPSTTADDARCEWTVYMEPSATPEQIKAVGALLRTKPHPGDVRYLDAKASYERFKKLFKDRPDMLNAASRGDFPPSFQVRTSVLPEQVIAEVENLPAVRNVDDFGYSMRTCPQS
jgi:hypothetical protein